MRKAKKFSLKTKTIRVILPHPPPSPYTILTDIIDIGAGKRQSTPSTAKRKK